MIQFNLLPDIKVEYIKAQKLKRIVLVCAFVAAVISVGITILMFSVSIAQKAHLSNVEEDIETLTKDLEETPELKNILSVQSQLNSLPALYDGRPAAERLPGYLDQITPANLGITKLILDYTTSSMEITGTADTLQVVNSFVDILKFTTYTVGENPTEEKAFNNVVLSQFSRDPKSATFKVTFSFSPTIFDNKQTIKLVVPSLVTTRAEVPGADLFNAPVETQTTEAQ